MNQTFSTLCAALAVGAMACAAGPVAVAGTIVTLESGNCFSGCGVIDVAASTTPTLLGNVLFVFENDFNAYVTNPSSGDVEYHLFSEEGLGNHDAIYFSSLATTSDPAIGAPCPVLSQCAAAITAPVDLTSIISGQDLDSGFTLVSVLAAPEPSAWALMILGVGFAGASLRRRRGLRSA
ncbi:MAG TPA: PEPxxWA-CTERM sorting domain-containing protein [Caulobacteraceae bacterium]|jgi:hypothetical protein|nr:PEPxxWA-CTERM sorting domain-containing protein [Caulobacteraceae bacterium]